jgi:hypothetical protein
MRSSERCWRRSADAVAKGVMATEAGFLVDVVAGTFGVVCGGRSV